MTTDTTNLPCSVWELFESAVNGNQEREAVIDPLNRAELCPGESKRWCFAELHDNALRIAALLHSQGVAAGDRVLVQLPNISELVAVYLAVARLGAIISPVPMQYRRHELAGIIAAASPRAVITTSQFKESNPLAEIEPLLSKSSACIVLGQCNTDQQVELASFANLAPLDASMPKPDADALYTLCWTSGTTGTPKGVPRRHHHWLAMLPVFEDATALPEFATMLAPFPMTNMAAISTFLIYWLRVKGRLVLHHPMDLPIFLTQIEEEKAEYTVAPPALLNLLLAKPELMAAKDLSSLRVIGSGSAPLSGSMIAGFRERLNIEIVNMFGSNEGCCLVADAQDVPDPQNRATNFPRFGYSRFGWRNRMAEQLLTRLVDTETEDLIEEPGRAGELRIKGPTVFEGYWQSDEDRQQVFDAQGFFRTGDLFEITGDNNEFYRFVGRCKDIIIRGGMKISPEEIDQVLAGHPDIVEAAVVGVADDVLGQKIGAVIVPRNESAPDLQALCDYLSERGLARFKLPEHLALSSALPRNPLGKVVRSELEKCFL